MVKCSFRDAVNRMAMFIILYYGKALLQSAIPASAPQHDLDIWREVPGISCIANLYLVVYNVYSNDINSALALGDFISKRYIQNFYEFNTFFCINMLHFVN